MTAVDEEGVVVSAMKRLPFAVRGQAMSTRPLRIGAARAGCTLVAILFATTICNRADADDDTAGSTIVAEAESFTPAGAGGWQRLPWGVNYYAATFGNTFLSRKAFLGAPEQVSGDGEAVASVTVSIPNSGRYLALVRYEAAPRFETRFTLRIEQGGKRRLDRLYGARDNLKVWPFDKRLQKEVTWPWGAVENVVWEGHDAAVDLDAGPATLTLVAARQPEPAAKRNVDLVMLTSDLEQVKERIAKEKYLPLDGMLTQAGDVWLKVHNRGPSPLDLTVNPGKEHSPYWVHQRKWKPAVIHADATSSTDWTDVGGLLDTLNDGQWTMDAKAASASPLSYSLEFGVPSAGGKIESIRTIEATGEHVELAYSADTRYSRRIRTAEDVLLDLVKHLRDSPVPGVAPKRTLIYGRTFDRNRKGPKYREGVDEFCRLMGATALNAGGGDDDVADRDANNSLIRGYIDLRDRSPDQLAKEVEKLKAAGRADKIAVVSLGDEIGLAHPPGKDHAGFRQWLKSHGLKPADVDPAAGGDWGAIHFSPDDDTARTKPGLFHYSRLYDHHYGIAAQKKLTDALRKDLPHAGIGANFSPHHWRYYLGQVYQWVSLFREGGMTMPWAEDYAWQVPIGSQQMNFIGLDLFRAGIRGKPDAKIQIYVMPHSPGNTPASWRRQFYGAIAHGAKVFNLFEFRPVEAAYTENHVTGEAMYDAVRRAIYELGTFEDLVQDGTVRPGVAGLWFSETGDIWDDSRPPFAAGKRTLYCAIRHQQLPLDAIVEADALDGTLKNYRVLYLADQHVSLAASKAIAEWVRAGGRLFATAGAGMFDESNQPNTTLRELMGVDQTALDEPKEPMKFEKQDLPFLQPIADASGVPIFEVRSRIGTNRGVSGNWKFGDDLSPAVTVKRVGSGTATYCAFLPGLTCFKPAIPLRPVDRGSTDDSMAHFIPTKFDARVSNLIADVATDVERPVVCSETLVETTIIDSPHGVIIPLINWSAGPVKQLHVKLNVAPPAGTKPQLGSGAKVSTDPDGRGFTFDLDVADALVFDARK
jgi:hypothetical protein